LPIASLYPFLYFMVSSKNPTHKKDKKPTLLQQQQQAKNKKKKERRRSDEAPLCFLYVCVCVFSCSLLLSSAG
jgi:hypothetical protein